MQASDFVAGDLPASFFCSIAADFDVLDEKNSHGADFRVDKGGGITNSYPVAIYVFWGWEMIGG